MSKNITVVRPMLLNGANRAVGYTGDVADELAAALVFRGDATYTAGNPVPPANATPGVAIYVAAVIDAGVQGQAIVQAGTFDQFLTSIGASLGAADSGGTGFKALRVPNATT